MPLHPFVIHIDLRSRQHRFDIPKQYNVGFIILNSSKFFQINHLIKSYVDIIVVRQEFQAAVLNIDEEQYFQGDGEDAAEHGVMFLTLFVKVEEDAMAEQVLVENVVT